MPPATPQAPDLSNLGTPQGNLNTAVANIGQFATSYQTPIHNSPVVLGGGTPSTNQSVADAFFSKIGSVVGEAGHMVEGAAGWVARQGYEAARGAIDYIPSAVKTGADYFHTYEYSAQAGELSSKLDQINTQYKNGQIDKQAYLSELNQWNKDNLSLSQNLTGLSNKIGSDANMFIKDSITVESDILTLAGGALSKAAGAVAKAGIADAASFLTSKGADAIFANSENIVARLAANKAEFGALPEVWQKTMQASVTDAFMNLGENATVAKAARVTVANLAIKYPLTFNWLSGTGNQLAQEYMSGKYGDAVKTLGFNMALVLAGGPIGVAMKYGGKALGRLGVLTFGEKSMIDLTSQQIGNGEVNKLYEAIQKAGPKAVQAFKDWAATNLAAEDGRVGSAVFRNINALKANGWDLTQMTHDDFVKQVMGWHEAQQTLTNALLKQGISAAEVNRYVVGRWTIHDVNRIAQKLSEGATPEERLNLWESLKVAHPNSAYANNENLDTQVKDFIKRYTNANNLKKQIASIEAEKPAGIKISKAEFNSMKKLGYVPIAPKNVEAPFVKGTEKLITGAAAKSDEFFQKAVKPLPILGDIGAFLTRAGLSPEKAQQSVQDMFRANLADEIQKSSIITTEGKLAEDKANTMIQKLSSYVHDINSHRFMLNHPPISDWRQLTVKEITQALNISEKQGREIAGAMNTSMLRIGWTERGVASKLMDVLQSANAGGKFSMNGYLRLQGAGRFAWNPFFAMKLAAKTEILSQLEAGGKWPSMTGMNTIMKIVFPGYAGALEDTSKMLESRGVFGEGFTGQAADETAAMVGHATSGTPGMVRSQKLSIAGLITSMSDRVGMKPEEFVNNYPTQTRDLVQSILHYDPNAKFLNSPLARTLNFAFFPFRFNMKVATFMARAIQRQPALTQIAVIHGTMQAHAFLTSEQGQVWQSQNADAIGLFSYFTPLEEINTVMAAGGIISNPKSAGTSVGSLGELGGLPIGFVTQILNAEGVLHTSGGYIDPKTGKPGVTYIPQTMKAKIATALATFIGSLYTYPGSEAGLPAKTKANYLLARGLVGGAQASEWQTQPTTQLTPQQQQYQQAIQNYQASQGGAQQAQPTEPAQQRVTTPMTGKTTAQPFYKSTGTSTPPTKKLKKSQEPLSLLPGQTKLGQL